MPDNFPPFDDASRNRIRRAAERGNPLFKELGLDPELFASEFSAPGSMLESAKPRSFLEALVRMSGRPPLVVRNDKVEGKSNLLIGGDDPHAFPNDISDRIAAVEGFLPSVGRLEFVNHDMAWGGTGWLISDDEPSPLIVTNRHVAVLVARRTYRGDGVFLFSPLSGARYAARLDTGEEAGAPENPARLFQIENFTYIADDAQSDVAFARLRVADGAALPQGLPLADTAAQPNELVAVVGYPAADPYRNDPAAMERYFRGLYDVKRFSPGFAMVGGANEILSHDCTTLGGNSGSPVISLTQKAVVGLHFSGQFGVGNSAVRASTLKALLAGERIMVQAPGLPATAADEARDVHHDAGHFSERPGYDAEFLQVASVPLPKVPVTLKLAKPTDATAERPFELRYRHFSALYSAEMKSPVVCALNLDGGKMRPIKRRDLAWGQDLRIPGDIQLTSADYSDPAIDRGHLVRRAATNWGKSDDEARQADADSFHYTICAPQHAGLNRNPEMWLGLEDYVLTSARTHGLRVCVFAGPVFSPDDPPFGTGGATIPLTFWKVVTTLAMDDEEVLRLHSTAYVLSQGQLIHDLLSRKGRPEAVEGFRFGAFRTYQVRVADLAELTGLDFGTIADADPLARALEKLETAPLPFKPLIGYGDIVL